MRIIALVPSKLKKTDTGIPLGSDAERAVWGAEALPKHKGCCLYPYDGM